MDNLPGTDHDSVEFTVCIYPPNNGAMLNICTTIRRLILCLKGVADPLDDIENAWTCWKDLFFLLLILLFLPQSGSKQS